MGGLGRGLVGAVSLPLGGALELLAAATSSAASVTGLGPPPGALLPRRPARVASGGPQAGPRSGDGAEPRPDNCIAPSTATRWFLVHVALPQISAALPRATVTAGATLSYQAHVEAESAQLEASQADEKDAEVGRAAAVSGLLRRGVLVAAAEGLAVLEV